MRNLACLGLMAVGLGLAGCMGPGNNTSGPGGSSLPPLPRPTDSPVRRSTPEAEAPNIPRAVNGLLAGVVMDRFDRKVPHASVLVVAVMEGKEKPPAPIDVQANDQGYFTIPGLEPGQSYQLTARSKDGERLMAGSVFVRPPDPRILIRVSEDLVTPDTPPPHGAPAAPEKKPAPEKKAPEKPAASLERPTPPGAARPETTIGIPVPPPDPTPKPPAPRRDLTIDIKGPPPKKDPLALEPPPVPALPPPPRSGGLPVPAVTAGPLETTSAPPASLLRKAPVPSCVMLRANHVEDFALNDVSGKPWEFRRDRKGRLVLLDFWHSQCRPCLRAIGHLNDLHTDFSSHGLEVIGIACESGPPEQRLPAVQSVRGRFNVKYRTLLWGNDGPGKPCPVYTQFNVGPVPTLKLIDDRGEVVWQSEGLNERQLYELRQEITRRLGLERR